MVVLLVGAQLAAFSWLTIVSRDLLRELGIFVPLFSHQSSVGYLDTSMLASCTIHLYSICNWLAHTPGLEASVLVGLKYCIMGSHKCCLVRIEPLTF